MNLNGFARMVWWSRCAAPLLRAAALSLPLPILPRSVKMRRCWKNGSMTVPSSLPMPWPNRNWHWNKPTRPTSRKAVSLPRQATTCCNRCMQHVCSVRRWNRVSAQLKINKPYSNWTVPCMVLKACSLPYWTSHVWRAEPFSQNVRPIHCMTC